MPEISLPAALLLPALHEPVQACLDRFLASERYWWVRDQPSAAELDGLAEEVAAEIQQM